MNRQAGFHIACDHGLDGAEVARVVREPRESSKWVDVHCAACRELLGAGSSLDGTSRLFAAHIPRCPSLGQKTEPILPRRFLDQIK